MGTWGKKLIALVLFLAVASGIVGYMYVTGGSNEPTFPGISQEKATIHSVTYNGSTLVLDVESIKENIDFNKILIRNRNTGLLVDSTSISDYLAEGENKIISANFRRPLASGNYTALLLTPTGSTFVSPNFTVP